MANFTSITLEANIGNDTVLNFVALGGANTEYRWTDSAQVANNSQTASANWPNTIRPGVGTFMAEQYAFTADASGAGVWSASAATGATGQTAPIETPASWAGHHTVTRWNWDATGTFASAPITTAYDTTADNSPTVRGNGTPLSGSADTLGGGLDRSYLKGFVWGQVATGATAATAGTGAPAAGPATPAITDGTTGAVTPTAGANWSTDQDLAADLDFAQFPSTPAAVTQSVWYILLSMFTGPNMLTGVYTPQIALKYTFI